MSLPSSVLVVGGGGREHAIVRSLLASPARPKVIVSPGNGGIAADAECFAVAAHDVPGLVALAQEQKVDFVIVGPEDPLSRGLVDALKELGIPAFGPTADGARLEASKVLTKHILLKYGIPTAAAQSFTNTQEALAYLHGRRCSVVIKADGLAAGKGVIVADDVPEAEAAIRDMLDDGKFGASGASVLVEDRLVGDETSILVVVSGREYMILPTSQDHKRIGEGDTGPNTGGMGTYSPAELVRPDVLYQIEQEIVRPSVDAIANEGMDFVGILFIGIMLTPIGPQVLEFNTRFGDPETQVVLPRLKTDLLEILWAATQSRLHEIQLEVHPEHAMCVVMASGGYPGKYAKDLPISLPANLPANTHIFHAGTRLAEPNQTLVTAGGRVLGITAMGPDLPTAAANAYALCRQVSWTDSYYRRDIGARQLNAK